MREERVRRVAVIGGGANDEHAVSLASAAAVARAVEASGLDAVPITIDRTGGWHGGAGRSLPSAEAVAIVAACDVAFPVLHGVNGEDGAAAGLLAMVGVPFVGSPVRAGAIGMDKWVTKLVAQAVGVDTAPGVLVRSAADASAVDAVPPFVVKPTNGGSSNGVTVVRRRSELADAIERACASGGQTLVESFVSGREVDIALFRDAAGVVRAGATLEIGVARGEVFGREQKYDGTASFTVPARVSAAEHAAIDGAARALYDALGCAGVARFDFFVTEAGVVLNEVNTTPGFTEQSQVPLMYAATGLPYERLVLALIEAAVPAG